MTCYTGSSVIETTADNTATANRTWKTGVTDWISTIWKYISSKCLHTHLEMHPGAVSISNKVFVTGSGNDDEWFFDYESGVLNFIGTNLPQRSKF